jgi:hypothetical protein
MSAMTAEEAPWPTDVSEVAGLWPLRLFRLLWALLAPH